eukprot:5228050-Alexandrium_andersonii.AAC.1
MPLCKVSPVAVATQRARKSGELAPLSMLTAGRTRTESHSAAQPSRLHVLGSKSPRCRAISPSS